VSASLCGSIGLSYRGMLVREPVHGMQGLLERQRYESLPKPVEVNLPLSGAGLLSSAVPLRRVALTERRAWQCCSNRSCENKTRQTRPSPFLKGEGGVLRDLHTRVEVLYISLHAARPSDELPKKIDAHVGQLPT